MSVVIWSGNLMAPRSGDVLPGNDGLLSDLGESGMPLVSSTAASTGDTTVIPPERLFPGARSSAAPEPERVADAVRTARDWLLARQVTDGFWCAELEGDTTLESYMVLLEAFFGRRGSERSRALARTIAEEMLEGGGWPQYRGGPAEISVSVLSYFAMKVAGESGDAPHMRSSRETILRLGGVGAANPYTNSPLALSGQLPGPAVPATPPEMIFLPGWSPFTVYDM